MLKVDLHTHTGDDVQDVIPYSTHALIDRAAELGFGGLAVTLHDRQRDTGDLADYARGRGVTLIPGDGTGPEISEATRRVLEGTGVKFDWDAANVRHIARHGITPEEAEEAIPELVERIEAGARAQWERVRSSDA